MVHQKKLEFILSKKIDYSDIKNYDIINEKTIHINVSALRMIVLLRQFIPCVFHEFLR